MFTLTVKNSGNRENSLYEGDYDKVMALANALKMFPNDVIYIKVYHEVGDDYVEDYYWESPEWEG